MAWRVPFMGKKQCGKNYYAQNGTEYSCLLNEGHDEECRFAVPREMIAKPAPVVAAPAVDPMLARAVSLRKAAAAKRDAAIAEVKKLDEWVRLVEMNPGLAKVIDDLVLAGIAVPVKPGEPS